MTKVSYFSYRREGVFRLADNVNIGRLWKSRDGYMIKLEGERPDEVYVSRETAAGVLNARYIKKEALK